MRLPNIYGQGAGFGFSGLEGPTDGPDFVGTLTGDRIGVAFQLETGARHTFALELPPGVRDVEYELVANDTILAKLSGFLGEGYLELCMVSHYVLVGRAKLANPIVIAETSSKQSFLEDCLVTEDAKGGTALFVQKNGEEHQFAFTFDPESVLEAAKSAKAAIGTDLKELIQKRMGFFTALPSIEVENPLVEKLYYKSLSVLKHNVKTADGFFKGLWTTPDRLPHRKMWLWDSAFHSFGLESISDDIARQAVEAVLDRQREDGFIAHMFNVDMNSEITQPPILAWAVERYVSRTKDLEFAKRALPKLHAYLDWDLKNRDANNNMLCEWFIEGDPMCRSGESGMDNSSRFDAAANMDAIDFSCFMKKEYDALAELEDLLGKTAEAEKSRKKALQISNAVNELLWNEELGIYVDRMMDGTLSDVMACSGFLPLWCGIATEERAQKLYAHLKNPSTFGTPLPIPSVAAKDETFGSDMWRGSVWINYNYMIAHGLKDYGQEAIADELIGKTIDAMAYWYGQCGSVYEFYHTDNTIAPQLLDRKGPNVKPIDIRRKIFSISDYGWSAALYVAMLNEGMYKG